jgi:hypothetical protein
MRALIEALLAGIDAYLSTLPGGKDLIPGSAFFRPSPFTRRLRMDLPAQAIDPGDEDSEDCDGDGYGGEI